MQAEHTDKQLRYCKEVLNRIRRSKYSTPFKEPVDPVKLGCPDYFTIVKHPMDISTIKAKLDKGEYECAEDFRTDFKLMIANCYLYNPEGTNVYVCGTEVDKLFDNLYFAMPQDSKRVKMSHEMEECARVMDEIMKTKYRRLTWPFLEPVDPVLVPDYYKVITNPMDMAKIQKKLMSGAYKTPKEFNSDFELMFENCFRYNAAGTEVFKCGVELKNVLKNLESAEDGVVEQIAELKNKVAAMEKEIDFLQAKIDKTRVYTNQERAELAKRIEELEEENIKGVVKIVQKYKKDLDLTRNEVEVDLKTFSNKAIDELANYLNGCV